MTKPLPPDRVKKRMGRPPGTTDYSPQQIDEALLALAYTRQLKATQEQLRIAGWEKVPTHTTLARWRTEFSGRLAELTEQHGSEIERHTVSSYLDIIDQATRASSVLIDKTLKQAQAGDLRDPAGSARNMATIAAIYQDKTLLIQGKPTKIFGKEKDVDEALRELANRFAVSGSAEEDEPKELE